MTLPQSSSWIADILHTLPDDKKQEFVNDLAYNAASFFPVSGEAIAAKEAKEFYDAGRYGMMTLAGLGALPLAGPFIRPALKAAGTVAKPVVKAAGKTAGAVTKPLMKLRDPELRGNVLAGQSNYIDNYYAPSADVTPTALEKKVAEQYLKFKGRDTKPAMIDRTAQAGRGMLKWAADAPANVLDAALNPVSRALFKETGINRRSQQKIRKLLMEGSEDPKQLSRLLDKATAQGIYMMHTGQQAGRLGKLSPELEELASYSYLGDAYVPATKENFLKGVKQTETLRDGKKLYVPPKDLETAYSFFEKNFNLRDGAKLVIKQPTGKSGNHLGDLVTKNPTNAAGRKAAEKMKKAGMKRTPNNWREALIEQSDGGKNFTVLRQDKDGGVWVRSGTAAKPFVGTAVVEGGVAGYSKMYPNGNTISFMYDQHDFLEKIPAVGDILAEVLPKDVVAVAGPIHHNIFSNKWGKNLEYRKSSTTETPTLKKDPSRMNQEELKGLLTDITTVRPSGTGVAKETAKVGGGFLTTLGGYAGAKKLLEDEEEE
jgi:hypothetical protein